MARRRGDPPLSQTTMTLDGPTLWDKCDKDLKNPVTPPMCVPWSLIDGFTTKCRIKRFRPSIKRIGLCEIMPPDQLHQSRGPWQ